MENKRFKTLLKILLTENQAVTITILAKKLCVSPSTIRNDLNVIEHILLLNGCILVKNQGIGVYINGSANQKQELLSKLETTKDNSIQIHSQEYRVYYILQKMLLNSNSYIKVDDLSEELFVSRSTIQKDLIKCTKWLNCFDCKIEIKRKTGFTINGTEINYRKALAELVNIKSKTSKLTNSGKIEHRRLGREFIQEIKNILQIDCSLIEKVLGDAENRLYINFSDESYSALSTHIAISINRIQTGNQITSNIKTKSFEKNREFKAAIAMSKDIEKYYNVHFKKTETQYLFLHIACAKYIATPTPKMSIELDESDKLCIDIAKKIISITERVYNQNFKEDHEFYMGLLIHLKPTVTRLLFGLTFDNPLLKEVKETYPRAYAIAFMSSEIFQKYIGIQLPEDEIAYIAIHIEAAIERKSNSLNTIVVCSTGMGTAELLATKIQKRFKQINIISVESFSEFSTRNTADIDLVLSTIPIKTKVPHLVVSPLLTSSDVNSIFNFIEKGDSNETQLRNFIDSSLVYQYTNCKNKEDVICRVYTECKKKGYVTSGYYNGVIKRENLYSTEIGKGVAVPHSPLEFVERSVIVLVKLDNPIKWDTTMVDIVLFIAISKSDSYHLTDLLKKIYSCFDNDIFLKDLRQEIHEEKIREILYKKCIEF